MKRIMRLKEFQKKYNITKEAAILAGVRAFLDLNEGGIPGYYREILLMYFEEETLIKAAKMNGINIKGKKD